MPRALRGFWGGGRLFMSEIPLYPEYSRPTGRKEEEPSCRISSSVRLCWELEEPKGPKGPEAGSSWTRSAQELQGCLAHKKAPPPACRTLQLVYAQGPTVIIGGGQFFMSEVPLYTGPSPGRATVDWSTEESYM